MSIMPTCRTGAREKQDSNAEGVQAGGSALSLAVQSLDPNLCIGTSPSKIAGMGDQKNYESDAAKELSATSVGLVKRYLLAGLGIFFVGLGALGVFLPGIPTVGPLLLASFFFTKSFPALEQRLIRNQFFARFLPYLDGSHEMPLRAKIITIGSPR